MKFYCEKLDLFFELQEESAALLVIESAVIYREVLQNLIESVNEDSDNWIFSENEKILKKGSMVGIVTSIFTLDFNNKKIQKCIIDNLYDIAAGEKYYIKMQELVRELESFFYELDFEFPYNINVEISDFKNVIKTGVTGITAPDDLVERVAEYIKISARLLQNRVLVFVNMIAYFNEKEWELIEKTARYEGIYLVCIERSDNRIIKNKVIVDSDWCRIV